MEKLGGGGGWGWTEIKITEKEESGKNGIRFGPYKGSPNLH